MDSFESGKAAKIVGVPERSLRYWATIGLLKPAKEAEGRPGIRRGYSFENLVEAAILRELSKLRVNVTQSKDALDIARKLGLGKNGTLCTIRIIGDRVELVDPEEMKKSTEWRNTEARFQEILRAPQISREGFDAALTILSQAKDGLTAKSIIYGSEASVIVPVHSLWMEIFERVKHG